LGTYRVISTSDEPFRNRAEAGRLLARELESARGPETVVLGIPRGGVVVAAEVARALDAELDIVLARKIGAPGNPEAAIGAISEDGRLFIDKSLAAYVRAESPYVEAEKRRQMERIRELAQEFRAVRPKAKLAGRTVIVTDDGVATGATMRAAAWAARHEGPKRLILALPVGSAEAIESLAEDADEIVCLRVPPYFAAVGQFYMEFGQTSDEEVRAILEGAAKGEGA
jgi:putative phosphoribosyl transferase